MKKNALKKIIVENGGVTLTNKGEVADLKKGYVISTVNNEFITSDIEVATNKILEYLNIIKGNGNLYAGVWLDNGLYYIDINIYTTSKKEALKIGKQNNQLAIFDCKNCNSIRLNYDIKFYTIYEKVGDDLQLVKQVDSLNAIKDFFKFYGLNYLKSAISSKKLIDNKYIICIDKIKINELA